MKLPHFAKVANLATFTQNKLIWRKIANLAYFLRWDSWDILHSLIYQKNGYPGSPGHPRACTIEVRKFLCFDPLNGELLSQTPMKLRFGITSKTKLLQQNWSHFQILHIKCHTMSYCTPLEHFFHQDDGNLDMCKSCYVVHYSVRYIWLWHIRICTSYI